MSWEHSTMHAVVLCALMGCSAILIGCQRGSAPAPLVEAEALSGEQSHGSSEGKLPRASQASQGHDEPGHDRACEDCEPPTIYACQYDSDCAVCHDGSNCGTVMSTDEVERRGADCNREDAAECEFSAPRCCRGLCARCGF